MLAIRLRRTGSKKRPFYRVVVTDSRTARDSSFVEVLGHYNPRTNPEKLELNRERFDHWVKTGATPSDTVRPRRCARWCRWQRSSTARKPPSISGTSNAKSFVSAVALAEAEDPARL